MARSSAKAKKQRPSRPVSFHEAIPATMPANRTFEHVAEHFGDTALAWNDAWRSFIKRAQPVNWPKLAANLSSHAHTGWHHARQQLAGLGRSSLVLASSSLHEAWRITRLCSITMTDLAIHAGQVARLAGLASSQAIKNYAPSIQADIASGLQRLRSRLGSKTLRRATAAAMVVAIGAGVYAAAALGAQTLRHYADRISSPAAIMAQKKTGTTILDKDGTVLYEGYGAQDGGFAPLDQLPKALADATLAAEDPEFFDHPGFSWQGTIRAAWIDLQHGSASQGGSTLTQQLVKNTLLTQDKNIVRKFNELLLSMRIEQRYSKDQILEMYLNSIYYGQGAAGVQAAAQTYFHKHAKDITLGEAALLAGLPLGPNRFDPHYDLEAATGRRDFVLSRMLALGKITKDQADAAKATPLALDGTAGAVAIDASAPEVIYARQIKLEAPHFVFYVLDQLRRQYGDDMVEFGGITVHTTLDLSKQHTAEDTIRRRVSQLTDHHVTNGALISIEPSSGNVLAMVGSLDYNAPGFGSYNVITSERQPGSSFKPIAYATAFKKGWNGATTVDDVPVSFPQADGSIYKPQNYDLKFHGKVTLRHALDNSLNIPAIKVIEYASVHDTIQTAHDLGITSLKDEARLGLSLVLGGGEVKAIDMATAYATFANGGVRVEPRAIQRVSDRVGNDITKAHPAVGTPVLDPRIAYMITHILSDDASRQPEFPANGPLRLSRPAAAKTGTTNDFRDNWTVGYTPQIATAVWVGNNDNSPMQNIDGITGAAPIWHDYMESALANLPVENFAMPSGMTAAAVCADGGLADGFTTGIIEVFASDNLPKTRCARRLPEASPSPATGSGDTGPGSPNPADQPDATPTPKPGRIKPLLPVLQ